VTVLPIRDTTTRDVTKKRRDTTTSGEPITVRMQPDQLKALDKRIGRNGPSRPEAIRQLVEIAMSSGHFAPNPAMLAIIDDWTTQNEPGLARCQAIGKLIEIGLRGKK
jgi:hypothetical protein